MKGNDLITQLNNGDRRAFKQVFDTYYKTICLFIRKYLPNPDQAEDLAQDIFLGIWEKKLQFSSVQALRAFLYQAARNKAINIIEHEKVKKDYQSKATPDCFTEDFFYTNYIENETQRLFQKILDGLSPRAREIIYMQLEGLKNQEIADKLKISVFTVKNHKAAVYKQLKENFKKIIILIALIILYCQNL